MIYLSEGVLLLGRLIAVLVLVLVFIYALFEPRKRLRLIISLLLAMIIIAHYFILLSISSYAVVSLYPLIVVESTTNGSVFYVDFGQLSIIILITLWRHEVKSLITRLKGSRRVGESQDTTR